MRSLAAALPLLGLLALASPASAAPPPADAKPLSEVIRQLEAAGDIAYFDEIEWDDGTWKIEYVKRDGAKVEVRLDPRTGQPRR